MPIGGRVVAYIQNQNYVECRRSSKLLVFNWYLLYLYIQGDSEGKVNTLGSDSIGHCERKSLY
jgi:hypothetical protein